MLVLCMTRFYKLKIEATYCSETSVNFQQTTRRHTPECGTRHNNSNLFKILGFHGGDYEGCLLGYKNPVRTSQETYYVSVTESSQLMLCKV
jgi:hypothetical protein